MARRADRYEVVRFVNGERAGSAGDDVAREEPLEIRVGGRAVSVTMRTPGHDAELALGFLVGEGVISRREDVERVRGCDQAAGDVADVIVGTRVAVDFARLTRHVFASSSCGVCGSASIEAVRKQFAPLQDDAAIDASVVSAFAERLRASQPTFDKTGGLHAAGVFRADGELVVAREDVGRHNAVDKTVGHAFLGGMLPLKGHALVVSGRASFEIVQKALAAGVPIVIAVSAPSSLAVDLAKEANITLIGFARPGRFNVYAHPERVRA